MHGTGRARSPVPHFALHVEPLEPSLEQLRCDERDDDTAEDDPRGAPHDVAAHADMPTVSYNAFAAHAWRNLSPGVSELTSAADHTPQSW